ncbi:MAG TPA: hypothetical protein P5076_10940, partial [Myxococcota bacterium]|nr:hypothetical protein [Myxococcota bacterium]
PPGYTTVVGKIFDGPTPSALVWEETVADGPCQLLTPRVPYCEEDCGGDALCVEDGQCRAYPAVQEVGEVLVQGIHTSSGATQFSMQPIAGNYQPAEELPYPPFAEGDVITFAAAGSAFAPAFTLEAVGIAPFSLASADIVLEDGQDVTLTWTPPAAAGSSRIALKLDISHHGGTKGKIVCDAPDSGSLTLPAAMLSQLLDLGVAGFPTIVVTRKSTGSATVPAGVVTLELLSGVVQAVSIPGLVSCNDDEDCPVEQTCQDDLSCGP